MSEYLKIEPGKCYFITFTVVRWLRVFLVDEYVNILIDSIIYCQNHKGLEIHAYCIMPNHVHMIASAKEGSLGAILRDMKKFTAKAIVKAIDNNPVDSKSDLYMLRFTNAAKQSRRHANVQFWQETNHPVELYSNKFIYQKLNYIHKNPVKAGLVKHPEDYRLSSACNESPIKVVPLKL